MGWDRGLEYRGLIGASACLRGSTTTACERSCNPNCGDPKGDRTNSESLPHAELRKEKVTDV